MHHLLQALRQWSPQAELLLWWRHWRQRSPQLRRRCRMRLLRWNQQQYGRQRRRCHQRPLRYCSAASRVWCARAPSLRGAQAVLAAAGPDCARNPPAQRPQQGWSRRTTSLSHGRWHRTAGRRWCHTRPGQGALGRPWLQRARCPGRRTPRCPRGSGGQLTHDAASQQPVGQPGLHQHRRSTVPALISQTTWASMAWIQSRHRAQAHGGGRWTAGRWRTSPPLHQCGLGACGAVAVWSAPRSPRRPRPPIRCPETPCHAAGCGTQTCPTR